jgi:type IV pilus assembly protein PilW
MTRVTAYRAPGRARMLGLSLIELMAALTIGLLLIAGALTVYMQSRNTYRTTDTAARMQETARYAFDVLEPDVRLAGFWGMKKGPSAVTDTVPAASITYNKCSTNDGWLGDASKYINAFDGDGSTAANWASMACGPTGLSARSDVLIVRRASAETSVLDTTKVQVHSNRAQATVFNSATAPGGYGTGPASETRDMVVNVYYIGTDNGLAALRRVSLRGMTMQDEPVITGVQDMQVELGIDTNGDGTIERYVKAGDAGTASILSARIYLLVQSESDEQGYQNAVNYVYANVNIPAANDKRRRILLSKTIQIRNAQS